MHLRIPPRVVRLHEVLDRKVALEPTRVRIEGPHPCDGCGRCCGGSCAGAADADPVGAVAGPPAETVDASSGNGAGDVNVPVDVGATAMTIGTATLSLRLPTHPTRTVALKRGKHRISRMPNHALAMSIPVVAGSLCFTDALRSRICRAGISGTGHATS
jgi:hypothetical protein